MLATFFSIIFISYSKRFGLIKSRQKNNDYWEINYL